MIPKWYRKECENFGLDADEVIKQINNGVYSFNQYCRDNELDAKAYHVSEINKAPEGAKG